MGAEKRVTAFCSGKTPWSIKAGSINDLVGLKPRADKVLEIHPLIPNGKWDWFCLDNVPYHGKLLTILWDKNGSKYNKGKGFRIYENGREIFAGKDLKKVLVKMK